MSKKVKCDNCQKKEMRSGSEGIYLSHYHGNTKDNRIHVCYDCYQNKEQEHLQNYAFIYSYNPDHYQKAGTGYLKTDSTNCYAGKKDQSGQVLKQKDCRHCSPWKFTDDDSKEKCAECGKKVEDSWFRGSGKNFCSFECIDIYRNKDSQQQEPPIIPPKNNNKDEDASNPTEICLVCGKNASSQEGTYKFRRNNEKEKNYCSLECMKKGMPTKNNLPQQEPPPKSKNINKGVSVEIKVILGVIILLLVSIAGLIGVKIYKKGRKKNIIVIYDRK